MIKFIYMYRNQLNLCMVEDLKIKALPIVHC